MVNCRKTVFPSEVTDGPVPGVVFSMVVMALIT